jgi:kynureninase
MAYPPTFDLSAEGALRLDARDPLRAFREQFHLPKGKDGTPLLYFCGNSLGLQPKNVREYLLQELDDWATLGVEGHFHAKNPWMPYHELLTEKMARVVGALPSETVVMNSLTVNLHLMMASFYRPTTERYKILMESDAFPSDRYAVASQTQWHGFAPEKAVVELRPRPGEVLLRHEDIAEAIEREGDSIVLVLLGSVNYYTGQAFDLKEIARLAHAKGCMVGYDLAHGAGNILPDLHNSDADFAVWCSYKYLNSGPGSLAGCFVHDRHARRFDLPRLAGWWGHNKDTRFNMRYDFDPIPGAEGWQLSNPAILSLAALRASLDVFDAATMPALREKSLLLTGYLAHLLEQMNHPAIRIITPSDPAQRGCQLSIQVVNADKSLHQRLTAAGVVSDWREPDVIRVAPAPLYNTFSDVFALAQAIKSQVVSG